MNIGVYITLLDDEFLIPYSFAAARKFFPQVKVLDVGSTDSSCSKVPKKHLIKAGKQDPKGYIDLKNSIAEKHDVVFWIDADEVYPESSLRKIQFLLETKRERILSYWRCVKIEDNGQIYIEEPFLRGYCAWKTDTNKLYRAWPGEHLLNVDPKWRDPKSWRDPRVWCWHGVLLNRSAKREATSRYKKRAYRFGEAKSRNTWERYNWLPWDDPVTDKYMPRKNNDA